MGKITKIEPTATEVPVTTNQSIQGHVNGEDIKSVLITAALFGASAIITSILGNLNLLHLGDTATLAVTVVLGAVAKVIQKFLDGPKI